MPGPGDATEYILGELARRLDEVAGRLETALSRLDGIYVRKDFYEQGQKTADSEHQRWVDQVKTLSGRVEDLEDDKKWLTRLVLGFIVMGVLGAVFVVAKIGGA